MSKKSYSNYSKPEEVVETPVEETVVEEIEDIVFEETEPVQLGVVTNCVRLRVRNEADANSDILGEIDALSVVQIELSESTDEFYKVCTASGLDGYCMKKFITLK